MSLCGQDHFDQGSGSRTDTANAIALIKHSQSVK